MNNRKLAAVGKKIMLMFSILPLLAILRLQCIFTFHYDFIKLAWVDVLVRGCFGPKRIHITKGKNKITL